MTTILEDALKLKQLCENFIKESDNEIKDEYLKKLAKYYWGANE